MNRNELQIVYATLRGLVLSYPALGELPAQPRFVFDYTPKSILQPRPDQPAFPAVGISKIGNTTRKLIDKHEDYARTEHEDRCYVWREAGRFDQACQVALFVSATEEIYNPVVFLRDWSQWLEKRILDKVRFPAIGDCIHGEQLQITSTAKPMEQEGKLLHSVKLTINAQGKYLVATPAGGPPLTGAKPLRIHVSPKP